MGSLMQCFRVYQHHHNAIVDKTGKGDKIPDNDTKLLKEFLDNIGNIVARIKLHVAGDANTCAPDSDWLIFKKHLNQIKVAGLSSKIAFANKFMLKPIMTARIVTNVVQKLSGEWFLPSESELIKELMSTPRDLCNSIKWMANGCSRWWIDPNNNHSSKAYC